MEDEEFQTNFRQSSGDNFFKILEERFHSIIPTLIKKILLFCDYNCAIVIARLDDVSIFSIENDMRENFHPGMVKAGETVEDYLGRFTDSQEKFTFFSGQRKWLHLIAETCRQFVGYIAPSQSATTANDPATGENGESSNPSTDNLPTLTTNKVGLDDLFKIIGAQTISVFNDSKRITLSAWSWPAREVACQLAANFKAKGNTGASLDLLYISPSHHADLLNCIVQSDLERFKSVLSSSLALSLRIDGSVDRMQKHNVYVLIHVITAAGEVKTFFLGFDIPVGNSALSYHIVTRKIVNEILPWDLLLFKTTSLVTDGEKKNTGHLNGLWQRLKEEKEEISEDPFITIWCVGHRENLGWKATCQMPIIDDLIKNIISVASYFRQSGEKTRLLDAIATEKKLNAPLHYPKHFEIRWMEFTHNLFYVFLRNWNAMMWHFKSAKETGFETLWLSKDRIRLAAFLCDVLTVLKIFQKTFQSSTISILHLPSKKTKLIADLTTLKSTPLENGWEELLLKETVTAVDGSIYLRDHKLVSNDRLRSGPFTFSTENRNQIIDTLIKNLNEYLDEDVDIQNGLAPLLELDPNASYDSLILCHSIIIPEMESEHFCMEYYDAANSLSTKDRKESLQSVLKLEQTSRKRFTVLKLALARAYALKPHSADVENIINIYNKYKDTDRELLSKRTLFNNIYVHTNMCTLIEFDPTAAAEYWINEKQRKPRHGTKSTQQEWYNGVFPEAKHYDRPNSRKIEF